MPLASRLSTESAGVGTSAFFTWQSTSTAIISTVSHSSCVKGIEASFTVLRSLVRNSGPENISDLPRVTELAGDCWD